LPPLSAILGELGHPPFPYPFGRVTPLPSSPVLQDLATSATRDRSASATVGHRRAAPAHQATARVSPRRLHLVRRIAAALTVSTSPFLGHLVRRSTWASRAAPPPRVWPSRSDHVVSASNARPLLRRGPPPRLDRAVRPWPSRLIGRPRVAGRHALHCSREPDSARHYAAGLIVF
jgi:hypothetical protein